VNQWYVTVKRISAFVEILQQNIATRMVQAELERQRLLALKPATLEEAIEKAVAERVAQEKDFLREMYDQDMAKLRAELVALKLKK
jgi:hypothetical protein